MTAEFDSNLLFAMDTHIFEIQMLPVRMYLFKSGSRFYQKRAALFSKDVFILASSEFAWQMTSPLLLQLVNLK